MQGEEALIIAGNNQAHLYKAGGNTADIISAIAEADTVSVSYVEEFAHTLEGADLAETCANIFHWVRNTIPYKEDGTGIQKVQLPGQLYNNRYANLGGTGEGGDCKSMSLMCSSILRSLGNYEFSYRFITENRNENFHHVYLIVAHEDEETGQPCYIPLDCTLSDFAVEVDYAKKKDLAPTQPDKSFSVGSNQCVTFNDSTLARNGLSRFDILNEGSGFRNEWSLRACEAQEYDARDKRRYAFPNNIVPEGWVLYPMGSEERQYGLEDKRRYGYDPHDTEHPFGLFESGYHNESYWELSTNEMKRDYQARKDALLKKCQKDIFAKLASTKPIQYSILQDKFRHQFDDFITLGSCLIYKYWGSINFLAFTACRGVGATSFPGIPFPAEYEPKRETAIAFYNAFRDVFGIHPENLIELCNLGTFQKYGVTLDYMLYRCYCLQLYGQPFAPHAGVPYWDNATATLKMNGSLDLEAGLKLASCFPAQGGIGRPFGEPYWSLAGHVINNGADDSSIEAWVAAHPRPGFVYADGTIEPGTIMNNGDGLSWEAQLRALEVYGKWMKGNMVMLPQPIYNPDVAMLSGAGIGIVPGLTESVVTLVVAIVSAVVTVAGIVAGLVVAFKKDANSSTVAIPTMDFKWDYQTADGCLIGHCVNPAGCQGAQTAKMCNGEIVELNPNPADPKNQPPDPGNFFTGAGSKKKLLALGGVALLGGAAVLAMD